MASSDVASELEKGSQNFSPVSDIDCKERRTENTEPGKMSMQKASYYLRCRCYPPELQHDKSDLEWSNPLLQVQSVLVGQAGHRGRVLPITYLDA